MGENEKDLKKKSILKDSTKRILMRALIGSIPIVPGKDIFDLVVDLNQSRNTIDEKIDAAVKSLKDASRLVGELEQSLKERTEKLNSLRQEVERYSELAEIEEEKANAIIQQLEVSINKGKNAERWVSLVINLIAGLILFGLGLILSPLINTFIKKIFKVE